jgi:hypothetical protein
MVLVVKIANRKWTRIDTDETGGARSPLHAAACALERFAWQ